MTSGRTSDDGRSEARLLVLHRGEAVGELSDEAPDMWFLEGRRR